MILSYCINKPIQIWSFISVYIHLSSSIFILERRSCVFIFPTFSSPQIRALNHVVQADGGRECLKNCFKWSHLAFENINYFHFNCCLFKLGLFEKLLQMISSHLRTSSTSISIVAFSSWDYGYALLKEAGIYDSAGKPVKQREVRKQKHFFQR